MCKTKIVQRWIYCTFKGLFLVLKLHESVMLLEVKCKLTCVALFAGRSQQAEIPGGVLLTPQVPGTKVS